MEDRRSLRKYFSNEVLAGPEESNLISYLGISSLG